MFFFNSAAATGAAYPAAQPGYAVTPAATAATYGTQRAASTAYDTAAYQAAATQGTYASKSPNICFISHQLWLNTKIYIRMCILLFVEYCMY